MKDNMTTVATLKQIAVRLPETLIERLDRHAHRMRRASPGVNVNRTDAVRSLLIEALARAERAEGEPGDAN